MLSILIMGQQTTILKFISSNEKLKPLINQEVKKERDNSLVLLQKQDKTKTLPGNPFQLLNTKLEMQECLFLIQNNNNILFGMPQCTKYFHTVDETQKYFFSYFLPY